MLHAARLAVALGYTFAAWVLAGALIYGGYRALPHAPGAAVHCGGVVLTFLPVFRLYYRRPYPLPPAAAACVAVGFIALLDLRLLAPYFLHAYDPFLSFWHWQLPAALVAGSVFAAGRGRLEPQRMLNKR